MQQKRSKNYLILVFLFSALFLTSCEDPELDALMSDYCECISQSRYDETKQMECAEMMNSITEKYEGQPRKIKTVLEKTDECY
ncbi:hypothetical protein [Brumimicrobium sp.]|uniref:hypothetical protein n=1 Tax=Brumimicrobium sp. TaxID=2029867 RepID=UPI0026226BE9|nr:hypothetical protein [uncultured Brumimicrobium sp.]